MSSHSASSLCNLDIIFGDLILKYNNLLELQLALLPVFLELSWPSHLLVVQRCWTVTGHSHSWGKYQQHTGHLKDRLKGITPVPLPGFWTYHYQNIYLVPEHILVNACITIHLCWNELVEVSKMFRKISLKNTYQRDGSNIVNKIWKDFWQINREACRQTDRWMGILVL